MIYLKKLTEQSNFVKQSLMMLTDAFLLMLALYLAVSLRLGEWFLIDAKVVALFLIIPIITIPVFKLSGLYRAVIRYIGYDALLLVIKTVSLVILLWTVILVLQEDRLVPRAVVFIFWLIAITFVGGIRIAMRNYFRSNTKENYKSKENIAIFGAGNAARQLVASLQAGVEFKPMLLIDDNSDLRNRTISGLKVYSRDEFLKFWEKNKKYSKHNFSDFILYMKELLIPSNNINQIFIAIPSATSAQIYSISKYLEQFSLPIKILPPVTEIIKGRVDFKSLRRVSINDLLDRQVVAPDEKLLAKNINKKNILVTGAGGSIGSELCRQIIKLKPKILILYEINEFFLYQIKKDLTSSKLEVIPILANILDKKRLELIVSKYKINTIFHAAAYKHVPLAESNPLEAINNNVFGSLNIVEVADKYNVENCVLISTDKAVRPTNIMGASKRIAELLFQAFDEISKNTTYSMVRFGNVLGSSGSVIPLFEEQIEKGGPVTVTHKDIIRYFMTIPEAAQLVIQASSMAKGGDVFLLDMGKPVKIIDLANRMIALSGRKINIEIIGLRPGEKLYEELLIGNENEKTKHPKIMRAKEIKLSFRELNNYLKKYKKYLKNQDLDNIKELLTAMSEVIAYKSALYK